MWRSVTCSKPVEQLIFQKISVHLCCGFVYECEKYSLLIFVEYFAFIVKNVCKKTWQLLVCFMSWYFLTILVAIYLYKYVYIHFMLNLYLYLVYIPRSRINDIINVNILSR